MFQPICQNNSRVPHFGPRSVIGFAFSLLVLVGGLIFPVQGFALDAGDLLDAPARYDGRTVKVIGTAGEPRYRESRGRPFTVFDLSDRRGRTVRVFIWDRLTVRRGERVEVEGRFVKSKAVGRHTIENEIEAASVRSLPDRLF